MNKGSVMWLCDSIKGPLEVTGPEFKGLCFL